MSDHPYEAGLTSRVFALPSVAADALVAQIPSLAKYDLGVLPFQGLVELIEAMPTLGRAGLAAAAEDGQPS